MVRREARPRANPWAQPEENKPAKQTEKSIWSGRRETLREYKAKEGMSKGVNVCIWSTAERSRKVSFGFDDMDTSDHLTGTVSAGVGLGGQSGVLRI